MFRNSTILGITDNISRLDNLLDEQNTTENSIISNNASTSHTSYNGSINIGPQPVPWVIDIRNFYRYGFETQLYGYVVPSVTITVVAINILMIAVFLKARFFAPTHIIIITIGISDCLTHLCSVFVVFYFYGFLEYKYFMPYDWCRIWHDFVEVFPSLFHTWSVWMTVLIAAQRYVLVAFPMKAKDYCTGRKTAVCIAACLFLSILIFIVGVFEYKYIAVEKPGLNDNKTVMMACGILPADFIGITIKDLLKFVSIKQFVTAIISAVIPILLLVIQEIMLICEFRKIHTRRKSMNINAASCKTTKKEKLMLKFTVCCVAVFLIGELLGAFIVLLDSIHLSFGLVIIADNILRSIVVVSNLIILLTTNANFVIFSCMSSEFRSKIKNICCYTPSD